jgi:murein DD-endopeptidase MepM/ murein hydrolase activator NlpD
MIEQCTVHGRGRPCDIVNAIVMARVLDGSVGGPGLGSGCEDGDQDGVEDVDDLCLETPPGVAPFDTVPGCTALDVVSRPESLTDPAAEGLGEGVKLLSSPEFAEVSEILSLRDLAAAAILDMALAHDDMRAGDVCTGAGAYRSLLDALVTERAVVEAAHGHIQLGLLHGGPATPSDHFGDGQLSVVAFDLALHELDQGIATAEVAAEAFERTCSSVSGGLVVSGRVAEIDDALGTLTLEDGPVLALTPGAISPPVAIGGMVDVAGTDVDVDAGAAIGIATSVSCNDCIDPSPQPLPACLHLKLAPVQGFAPYSYTPVERHRLDAYEGHTPSGDLELEQGMRLVVSQTACDGISSTGSYLRYSLQLKIDGVVWKEDVTTQDGPVKFPSDLTLETPHTLTSTVRRQNCTTQSGCNPSFANVTPPTSHDFVMNAGGSLCDAVHATDEFDMEDDDPAEFRWQLVTGFSHDSNAVQPSDSPVFSAQTCEAGLSSPACLGGTIVETVQNTGFKIWNDDFFPVHGPNSYLHRSLLRNTHGVLTAAGMGWPKIQGSRNGSAYSYSCEVLPIVRDVVNYCTAPATEDSYYRYPLYPGGPNDPNNWIVAKGTWTQDPGHTGKQNHALDIDAEFGAQIRATRGGRVVMLKESSTPLSQTAYGPMNSEICYEQLVACFQSAGTGSCTNSSECAMGQQCIEGGCAASASVTACMNAYPCDNGNYLYLRHQDGTYATYWHMCQNCVTPVEGQVLRRSEEIGGVGDTGNSYANHLHYHVQTANGIDSTWSIPQRYQTAATESPDNLCQIPENDDRLPSSNDPMDFY